MTKDIDWEAEMEALDASLPERLERAAQMAEFSDMWTDTERLMPATGVADLIWEAHSEILGWRALNEERKASRACPLGDDCDLTIAWMAGRESAKDELEAKLRESALQELSALGQASEAYQAQLAAEAKLKWVLEERDTTFALMLKRAETAEAKLAKAVEALDEAVYLLAPTEKDMERQAGIYRIVTTLAELKGQDDE